MAVEHDTVSKALREFLPEEIAELSYLTLVTRQVGLRPLAGLPQAHGEDDVFCASTMPRFMPGTVDERFQRAASTHIERPNTLGGIHFMTGNGEKINAKFIHQRGNFADGLRRIRVQQHAMRPGDTADSAMGWSVPTSLLACIMLINSV